MKGRFVTKVEEEVLLTIPEMPKENSSSEGGMTAEKNPQRVGGN